MSVRPRMTNLFEQLGLDSSDEAIALFNLSSMKYFNLSSMKYFSFLASFGKLAYLDLSNKPL